MNVEYYAREEPSQAMLSIVDITTQMAATKKETLQTVRLQGDHGLFLTKVATTELFYSDDQLQGAVEVRLDFSGMAENEEKTAQFKIKNEGDNPVSILLVGPTGDVLRQGDVLKTAHALVSVTYSSATIGSKSEEDFSVTVTVCFFLLFWPTSKRVWCQQTNALSIESSPM